MIETCQFDMPTMLPESGIFRGPSTPNLAGQELPLLNDTRGRTGGGRVGGDGFWRPRVAPPSTYLWHPPPAAANVALEQLRIARIKRQQSAHMLFAPGS